MCCFNFGFTQEDSLISTQEFRVFGAGDLNTVDEFYQSDFGVGLYQNFMVNKYFTPVIGLEFNYSIYHRNYIYNGHFSHYSNVDNTSNNLLLPIYFKSSFGENIQPFIGAGVSFQLISAGKETSTLHTDNVDIVNQTWTHSEENYERNSTNSGSCFTFQSGIQLPLNRTKLIAGLELRYAFSRLDGYATYRPILLRGSIGFTF